MFGSDYDVLGHSKSGAAFSLRIDLGQELSIHVIGKIAGYVSGLLPVS